MTTKILRDIKESTTLLILLELATGRHNRLKTLAERLGITIQGVSDYLKRMTNDGLVSHIRGEYRVTQKGVELLHRSFIEIKDFIDDSMEKLDIVHVCTAIAGREIRKDDEVGLFMENGVLTAYPNKRSNSKGISISDASKGEDFGVRDLEGIVLLYPGRLWIVELPDIKSGGSRRVPLKKAKRMCSKTGIDRIAALDLTGLALIKRLKLKCHIELAAHEATVEALQKGMNVMTFGSGEESMRLVSKVNEFNAGSPRNIKYNIISLD
jgi:putative transcriptional regulator